ncbi:MAG: carbohydrate ABC transporter substrate-binding protein [Anaerolineae bacterium]|nr:carbohydrate ABC transporter substrate-binding protein [Anaerolineae bacterium]
MHSKWMLIVVTLVSVLALALAGCAPTETPTDEPTDAPTGEPTDEPTDAPTGEPTDEPPEEMTLTILSPVNPDDPVAAVWDTVYADFQEAYPNITVEVENVPADELVVKAETAFVGGVEQDIILMNYPHLTDNWIEDGLTIDVSSYLEEWGLGDTFYESAIDDYMTNDGKLPAFPITGFTWPMWYNTAILEAAGVEMPTTLDELIAAAPLIRDAGYGPIVTGGSDWTGARLYMLLLSSYMTPQEFNTLLQEGGYADNPDVVAATEKFVEMRDGGVFVDDVEGLEFNSMNAAFFAGEAAAMHAGSWSFADAPDDMVEDIYLGGLPLPEGSPHDRPVMFGGFGALALHVTRNGAENLEAVKTFVQYLYQPDVFVQFVNQAGMVAPLKDLPVDESAVPQLFADSLSLPERAEFSGNPDLVPGEIGDPWIAVVTDGFIPDGMTAEEILTELDALYAGLE